ncbi:hypothetical protein DMO16_19530 [Fictibacillus sp. S7]|nr:hypothetical protein DMO16_19530 [Fictibacillus sp. S7]
MDAGCHEDVRNPEHTISFIEQEATSGLPVRLCRLHNVPSLKQDMEKQGEAVWKHFNRGKDQQQWYYCSRVQALRKKVRGITLYVQLEKEVAELFDLQGNSETET